MSKPFISHLVDGDNCPGPGNIIFDSSDHMRFEDAQCVSEHNYGAHRRLVIEKNISGDRGYTVSILKLCRPPKATCRSRKRTVSPSTG